MQNFDIDILKKNVRSLMEQHGTKQDAIAKYLSLFSVGFFRISQQLL